MVAEGETPRSRGQGTQRASTCLPGPHGRGSRARSTPGSGWGERHTSLSRRSSGTSLRTSTAKGGVQPVPARVPGPPAARRGSRQMASGHCEVRS